MKNLYVVEGICCFTLLKVVDDNDGNSFVDKRFDEKFVCGKRNLIFCAAMNVFGWS